MESASLLMMIPCTLEHEKESATSCSGGTAVQSRQRTSAPTGGTHQPLYPPVGGGVSASTLGTPAEPPRDACSTSKRAKRKERRRRKAEAVSEAIGTAATTQAIMRMSDQEERCKEGQQLGIRDIAGCDDDEDVPGDGDYDAELSEFESYLAELEKRAVASSSSWLPAASGRAGRCCMWH